MTKSQRVLLVLIQATMFLLALTLLIVVLIDPNYNKPGGIIASFSLPFLPNFIHKVFAVKVSFRLQLIYFVFLFFSLFLGIDLDFYKTVPFFDKAVHLVSGALSVIVAWYALIFFKADKTDKRFQAIFIICFCVVIGVAWELFEFGCDKLLGQNMQQLIQIGVDDTMFDLISATVGACIGTMFMMRFAKPIEKFSINQNK